MIVPLQRIFYEWGESRMRPEDRCYYIEGAAASPVGTIADLTRYLARQGHDVLTYRIRDADGVRWMPDISVRIAPSRSLEPSDE